MTRCRPATVFAGFDDGTYEGWTVANEPGNWANGPWTDAPATGTLPGQNPVTGFIGAGLVNGFDDGDWPVGTMESPDLHDRGRLRQLPRGRRQPPARRRARSSATSRPRGVCCSTASNSPTARPSPTPAGSVTGDFATEPWRNPSTAGGDYYLGAKRINTWEGGPQGRRQHRRPSRRRRSRSSPVRTTSRSSSAAASAPTAPSRPSSLVDGEVVRSATGPRGRRSSTGSRWDVSEFAGSEAQLPGCATTPPAAGATSPSTTSCSAPSPRRCAPTRRRVNLVVDGEVVRTATGANSETLDWASWNVDGVRGPRGIRSASSTTTGSAGATSWSTR